MKVHVENPRYGRLQRLPNDHAVVSLCSFFTGSQGQPYMEFSGMEPSRFLSDKHREMYGVEMPAEEIGIPRLERRIGEGSQRLISDGLNKGGALGVGENPYAKAAQLLGENPNEALAALGQTDVARLSRLVAMYLSRQSK